MLQDSGYDVAEEQDGEQTMQTARDLRPELVILDLQMPRLDAYAAAGGLRCLTEFRQIPIVALIAKQSQIGLDVITQAGFSTYIRRPVCPARLRQYIEGLLEFAA
jgi:two-component system cell cycle response regulator DivK